MIPWYDNIPLVSYIFLRGRCRYCKAKISPLYFVVEALTGGVFLLLYSHFGLSAEFFIFTVVGGSLIVSSFIDLKIQEIPDEITLPGLGIGLILSTIYPALMSQSGHLLGLAYSLLGALAGGGLIYGLGVIGKIIFKRDAMGGGDVKLMAMLGAFMGWRLITLVFFIAPFFGAVIGIISKIKNKEDLIPYGPHLSLAAIIALLWGNRILGWLLI